MMTKERADAFMAGAAAFRSGKPISSNPHPSESPLYAAWRAGWRCVRTVEDVPGIRVPSMPLMALVLALVAGCSGPEMVSNDCPKEPAAGMIEGVSPPEDDGFNTFLRFPGRMQIPVISVKDQHGRERAVDHTTNPDTGEVVVHGVFPVIVMRSGPHTACFVNRAWEPVGRRPRT